MVVVRGQTVVRGPTTTTAAAITITPQHIIPSPQLRPGDWIMLDNLKVQHGRLPYEADPKQKRVLLTVYTTPLPSY